jgi:hypothetical protein
VQPGVKAPGPAAHNDGSGVPSAGSVSKQPEPDRRFVPGGRFAPVTDAGGAGQDGSLRAGLPVPADECPVSTRATLARARSGGARFPIDRPMYKPRWKSCARPIIRYSTVQVQYTGT